MNYKKIINIILINILIIFALFSILELYSYNKLKSKNAVGLIGFNKICEKTSDPVKIKYGKVNKFDYIRNKNLFRPVKFGKKSKRPIIFFGCSFARGYGLEDWQTLSYKISELTDRTVYNRASEGWGTQHILYQLRRDDFKKEVPDAEYIIYTFIYDHLNRFFEYNICDFSFESMLRYKIKNGNFIEIKQSFLPFYSLFTVRYIQDALTDIKNTNKEDQLFIFNSVMNECLRLTRKQYPNSKFIILVYRERNVDDLVQDMFKENVKNLENNGFIVIDAQDLVGHRFDSKQYLIADMNHPSEKAWEEIAPKLAKYLKL